MTKVSRDDVFIRDEKGPDWFEDFLRSFSSNEKNSSVQDIIDAMTNRRGNTIESVVQSYREQVGLDALANDTEEDVNIKEASTIELEFSRKLSIRQAEQENKSVVDIINSDSSIKAAIDSMLEHSGGTKKVHSIIGFLRDRLGENTVSYTDKELNKYIIDRKKHFSSLTEEEGPANVGLIGLDDDHDDDVADYVLHDGLK